jgi:hypothetical protein
MEILQSSLGPPVYLIFDRNRDMILVLLAKLLGYRVLTGTNKILNIQADTLERAEIIRTRIISAYVRIFRIINIVAGITGALLGLLTAIAWWFADVPLFVKILWFAIGAVVLSVGIGYIRYIVKLADEDLMPSSQEDPEDLDNPEESSWDEI